MRSRHRNTSGLGLIELGIILIGVAIIAVAAVTGMHRRAVQQQRDVTIERFGLIQDGLARYAADNGGMFPTQKQGGLQALVTRPKIAPLPHVWRGPYVESAAVLVDGWGNPFFYTQPGGGDPARPYDVWSFGRDRRQDGEGPDRDVNSWERRTQLP
jgi:general secretion pathway protein G